MLLILKLLLYLCGSHCVCDTDLIVVDDSQSDSFLRRINTSPAQPPGPLLCLLLLTIMMLIKFLEIQPSRENSVNNNKHVYCY